MDLKERLKKAKLERDKDVSRKQKAEAALEEEQRRMEEQMKILKDETQNLNEDLSADSTYDATMGHMD